LLRFASLPSFIHSIVLTASWIDGHAHLIIDTTQPQSKIRIKDLFRNELKPFSRHPACINPRFAQKFNPPSLPHIFSSQRHDGVDTVIQQRVPSDDNLDMSIVPTGRQLTANVLKPRGFFFERFALNVGNVGVTQQGAIAKDESRFDDRIVGGDEFDLTGAHARVVAFQKGQLANVGGLGKVKGLHVIDNVGAVFFGLVVVDADPLELEVGDANGSAPTAIFTFIGQLNAANDLLDGKLEPNLLTRYHVGRTGDEYSLAIGHESKGLVRTDSRRDRHFKDLGFGGGHGFFSLRRWHNPNLHVGSGITRTGDHESLAIDIDRELHAWIDVGRNGDQEGLSRSPRFGSGLIDAPDFLGHGHGSTT
jgi:hypothetical protein